MDYKIGEFELKHLKTEKCIICGKKAVCWHGYVIAKSKMALGNYINTHVISGYCEEHLQESINNEDIVNSKPYDSELMGKCIPLFE